MSEETLSNKIDKLIQLNTQILNKLDIIGKTEKLPFKHQDLIDYLKSQGRIDQNKSEEPIAQDKECIKTPDQAINILQEFINKKTKEKCLTKEELIAYFSQTKKPITTDLVPPFRK